MVVALWHRGAHRDGVGVRVFAVDGAGTCAGLGYCGAYWRLLRAVYPPAAHTIDTAATHGAATAAAGHGDSATATRVSPHQWGLFDRGYALPGHTVAMLYLGIRQSTGRAFPLYMGLLTLNVGIYLWVPGWAHAYHLLQIYTIPAAVSVLWLLHAHRHELQPTVLHSLRLAASSILYVSATAVKKEKGITRRCIALSRWLQGGASMYNTGSDLYAPFS